MEVNRWRVMATACAWINLGIAIAAAGAGMPAPFYAAGIGAVLCFAGRVAL